MTAKYAASLRSLLSLEERKLLEKLKTPVLIQDYLDELPINFELKGETIYSPRRVMCEGKAHCIEGALFAAAALAYHGQPPLLMDFQTAPYDDDHVVALFKEGGRWGAISKTNHSILRWRDPVYLNPRELAMSYFHEYFVGDGEKTMRAFSEPYDLSKHGTDWVVAEEDLVDLVIDLDDSPHFPVAERKAMRKLRFAGPIETKALDLTEWSKKEIRNRF